MKAAFLIKQKSADKSFEIREVDKPSPKAGEILVAVSSFGLNYADVMARLGVYPDMPKMPCVLGYDVIGTVDSVGEGVRDFAVGDFVCALTRFGGYAEYAVADARGVIKIDAQMPNYEALSIATQLSTAYHAAIENVNLFEGDNVLIHAAAGGVGLGLVHLAQYKKCNIVGIAGSREKLDYLKSFGVQHVINYKTEDWTEVLKSNGLYKKIDAIFDSVGGANVPKGIKSLTSDGKYVLFGSAKLSESRNPLMTLYRVTQYGFNSPIRFLMSSKSLIGINMLAVADHKPDVVGRCMKGVYKLYQQGVFGEILGKSYPVSKLAEAHDALEKGKTMGKIAIEWT